MPRAIVRLALLLGLALGPTAALGCYQVPQPACGFICGPAGACPSSYTCSTDNRCHLDGSDPTLVCGAADAGVDAPDASVDATDASAGPFIVSYYPAADATDVSIAADVELVFSEDVFGASMANVRVDQGATPVAATVVTIGNVVTVSPASPLVPNATFTVTVDTGIVDVNNRPLIGVPLAWQFTTGADTVSPIAIAFAPTNLATGVGVEVDVTAQFDEDVVGVSASSFTLTDGVTPIAGAVSYGVATRIARFDPDDQLAASTTYTATLTGAITDAAANPLANAPVSWTFTTGADTVAPAVVMTTPVDASTAVSTATTIVVRFDEPVMGVDLTTFTVSDGATIAGTLTSALGGREHTFTPSAALPDTTAITVTLTTGITDLAANPLAAPVAFTFTTAP